MVSYMHEIFNIWFLSPPGRNCLNQFADSRLFSERYNSLRKSQHQSPCRDAHASLRVRGQFHVYVSARDVCIRGIAHVLHEGNRHGSHDTATDTVGVTLMAEVMAHKHTCTAYQVTGGFIVYALCSDGIYPSRIGDLKSG